MHLMRIRGNYVMCRKRFNLRMVNEHLKLQTFLILIVRKANLGLYGHSILVRYQIFERDFLRGRLNCTNTDK